jgi:hypothetical protein
VTAAAAAIASATATSGQANPMPRQGEAAEQDAQARLHWIRDVTYDADRSQVRTGTGPRVMASLRKSGHRHLAADRPHHVAVALRYHTRQPGRPLQPSSDANDDRGSGVPSPVLEAVVPVPVPAWQLSADYRPQKVTFASRPEPERL